ncbi:MAG: aminotransferase class V-fold PLP-dependent enzyme [Treponemataceae bacterium]|nr:MAG: aminotransferase class V-fold PLP-dependent enzyme [Treponemataceae bacterium]
MVYLDNAATSFPKPDRVYQAHDKALRESGNPGRSGHTLSLAAGRLVEQARFVLAELFNCPSPQSISFAYNATAAINLALKGCLKSGDHVITGTLSHNAVARPLEFLKTRGVAVTKIPSSPVSGVNIDDVRRAIMPETKLIVLTHVSNVSGAENDVTEIGALCREKGVFFLVDAAQSAGCKPIDMRAMNIDMLAFPGHKSLFGPQGTGGLYVREGIALEPLVHGGTGSRSEDLAMPRETPGRYESGTQNAPGIAALSEGVRFVRDAGVENIEAHEAELANALVEGLSSIKGVRLFGPPAGEKRSGVVSFTLDKIDPQQASAALDSAFGIAVRSGLHCAPDAHLTLGTLETGGTIRASCGFFNTLDDIAALVAAIKEMAQ